MMRKLLTVLMAAWAIHAHAQDPSAQVHFASDQDRPLRGQWQCLDGILQAARECAECAIEVEGHTDAQASEAYNKTLSQRRVHTVITYFEQAGIDPDRIVARPFGEGRPIADNASEQGRSMNRRVTVWLSGYQHFVLDKLKQNGGGKSPLDRCRQLAHLDQWFEIDPQVDNVLEGRDGTVLSIRAGTFAGEKKVRVRLREGNDYAAMILHQLETQTTTGEFLQSDGMVQVYAERDGEMIEVEKGRSIGVWMRQGDPTGGYQAYQGMTNPQGWQNWNLARDGEWTARRLGKYPNVPLKMQPVQVRKKFFSRAFVWCGNLFLPKPKHHSYFRTAYVCRPDSSAYDVIEKWLTQSAGGKKQDLLPESVQDIVRNNPYYALTTANYAWINCDRWPKARRKNTVRVGLPAAVGAFAVVVFKKIRGLIRFPSWDNQYEPVALPMAEEVSILITEPLEDGFRVRIKDLTVGGEEGEWSEWQELSVEGYVEWLGNLQTPPVVASR